MRYIKLMTLRAIQPRVTGHFGPKTLRHSSDGSELSRQFGTRAAVSKRQFRPKCRIVPPRGPNCPAPWTEVSRCKQYCINLSTPCSHNCGRVYVTVRCPSVGPSVCFIYRKLQKRAAGLLLWARRTGDTDRQRRPSGAEQQGAQQHGVQQQMRAVPRCQLT